MTKQAPARRFAKFALILSSALLLGGCKRAKISSYEVPKQQAAKIEMPAPEAASQGTVKDQRVLVALAADAGTTWFFKLTGDDELVSHQKSNLVEFLKGVTLEARTNPTSGAAATGAAEKPGFKWSSLPQSWKDLPASGMRAATFTISGDSGQQADLGVIPMPIDIAGRELEFVNMWREQIGLSPAPPDVLAQIREPVTIGNLKGEMFEMVNKGVVTPNPHGSFATAGSGSAVDPHAGLDMSSMPAATGAALAGPGPAAGSPKWSVPAGWTATAPGAMLLAKYDVSGSDTEVSVLPLANDGGGLLMNINRWRGQLQLKPVSDSDLDSVASTVDASGAKATVVDMTGNGKRIVGLIVPHGGQTWFYKCMGKPDAVGRTKDAFLKFAESAQY